jgi:hypothetical protein
MRKSLMVAWMLAALQVVSMGQNPPPQNPPSQSPTVTGTRTAPATALSGISGIQNEAGAEAPETEDGSGALPQIPGLLGGIGITPAFLTELERSNYLRGGVNVGAAYDDNPLLLSTGSDTSESIFPNLSIEESSSRIRWTLGYAGGLTVNQRFTSENEGSHSLNFDSQYRLTPHLNLRVAERFFLTTGFFDAGNGAEAVASSGGPNASLITPLATQRSSVTTVETNYHFALNDLIGASGSFYDLHFSNVPATSGVLTLNNAQTASGTAFWLHRLFRRDWAGVSYRFDRITFNPGGETRAHGFFAVNTINVSKRVTLTGFVGPQYSENQGVVPPATESTQSNLWSVAGGAEGVWRDDRTSASGGYARTISDGGGILGTVLLQTVHGEFRRELVPGWAAAVTASHGRNREIIGPPGSANSIHLTSAGVSLERNVGKSIGLRLGYSHDFQQQYFAPAATPPTLDASRNRFFATLSYQWAKPLGI